MCNACGFYCCAWDGFEGCGCDHCPERACWDKDDLEREYGDDDEIYDFAGVAGLTLPRWRLRRPAEANAVREGTPA